MYTAAASTDAQASFWALPCLQLQLIIFPSLSIKRVADWHLQRTCQCFHPQSDAQSLTWVGAWTPSALAWLQLSPESIDATAALRVVLICPHVTRVCPLPALDCSCCCASALLLLSLGYPLSALLATVKLKVDCPTLESNNLRTPGRSQCSLPQYSQGPASTRKSTTAIEPEKLVGKNHLLHRKTCVLQKGERCMRNTT